ncbi:MAG: DUF2779 domain-containing protein, partial [Myxococcota bacterium]|nr:DUF2779 domain-containing protein [Myxococcota bacterium]
DWRKQRRRTEALWPMTPEGLTREDVVAGLQCERRLHLQWQTRTTANPKTSSQSRVREAAFLRFPNGQALEGDFNQRQLATEAALETPGPWALFGACAQHAGVQIQPDILYKTSANELGVFTIRKSASIKRTTYYDLAVEVWVLRGCGQAPSSARVLHINSEYCREDHGLDPNQLFHSVEALPFLEGRVSEVDSQIGPLKEPTLRSVAPEVSVGPHCKSPSRCPFLNDCSPNAGAFHVSRLPHGNRLAQRLPDSAIEDIRAIPMPTRMSPLQKRALSCIQKGEDWVGPGLESTLQNVQFPLGYLDFESVAPAVPLHAQTHPYQSLPTQWSLHIQRQDGQLTHQEFIHDHNSDPRKAFADSLLEAVSEVGSLVVYSPAESRVLKALAEQFPEHTEALEAVRARLYDLLAVIQRHYYHPDFNGTFTLKRVLPSLVDDLSYDDLEIRNGAMAAQRYPELILSKPQTDFHRSLRHSLLRYCERDTLALVRIRQALLERCKHSPH